MDYIKGWFALLLPQATKHEKLLYLLLLLLLRLVLLVAGSAAVAGAMSCLVLPLLHVFLLLVFMANAGNLLEPAAAY
jgi:hypothetical protein